MSWQGDGNTNADFPNAQSIYSGIADALKAGGGTATLSVDGRFTKKPDAAIVVFGEHPYAEGRGDVRTLEFQPGDKQALALLKRLKAAGIPTVSVFLSGRPLWVNPELNASDAFVAAWFPGSEGAAVADVLIGDRSARPRKDFTGRLSFSWPKTAAQFTLNQGTPGYDPLFALGYGLGYASRTTVPQLSELPGIDASLANTGLFISRGQVPKPFSFATDGGVARRPVDGPQTQEGAVELKWPAGRPGTVRIGGQPLDLTRETNTEMLLQLTYRVTQAPAGPVSLAMGSGRLDATSLFTGSVANDAAGGWKTVRIPLKCFATHGGDMAKVTSPFALTAGGPFTLALADLRLAADPAGSVCPN